MSEDGAAVAPLSPIFRDGLAVLFPRFSIRSLIALTFAAALCAYSIGRALEEVEWAAGVAVALGAMFVSILLFGLLFAASWAFGSIVTISFSGPRTKSASDRSPFSSAGAVDGTEAHSPFASPERLPPKVILDRDVPLE
jgi:hypothetical protein